MISCSWIPWRRPSDGEVVGYLAPSGPDLFTPFTLIGTPLAEALPRAAAQATLEHDGLIALARRWWCPLPPFSLPSCFTVDAPEPGWTPRPILIVEVSPDCCRARLEYPDVDERTAHIYLPLPAADLLMV